MAGRVTLKGVKSGIVLKLPTDCSFEELLPQVEEKFINTAEFFGEKHLILSIEGRELSEMEAAQILRLLAEHTKVKCEGVLLENKEINGRFKDILGTDPGHEKELARIKEENKAMKEAIDVLQAAVDPANCRVYMGNLRSGANIESPGSVMVIGDVKPGATVTAGGSIFILGALQGNADAGAYGDSDAFIFALNMNPIQLRISDAMAIAADNAQKQKKNPFAKKDMIMPEVALITEGHIVITELESELMKKNKFYRRKAADSNLKVSRSARTSSDSAKKKEKNSSAKDTQ